MPCRGNAFLALLSKPFYVTRPDPTSFLFSKDCRYKQVKFSENYSNAAQSELIQNPINEKLLIIPKK